MYQPKNNALQNSRVSSLDHYKKMYKDSVEFPEKFWGEISERINWVEPWDNVSNYNFRKGGTHSSLQAKKYKTSIRRISGPYELR